MKVLLPIHRLQAAGIGTVQRGLVKHLPSVLAPGEDLCVAGNDIDVEALPAAVTQLDPHPPRESRIGRVSYEQLRLARLARGVDLVHLTDYRPLLLSRTPYVVTIHDVFILDHPRWYPAHVAAVKHTLFAAMRIRPPAAVVCDSRYTRDRLLHGAPWIARSPIHVVHPGVEAAPPREGSGDDYFLTVSTIEPRKNHLTLLEAFTNARRAGLGLTWKIAGAAGYSSEPIIERLRTTEGVEFLGRVDVDELDRLYARARFVATPSLGEGFGFPPLEAMARGVPVLASSGSGLDEAVGNAALRVPAQDVRAWTDRLLQLARSDDSGLREAGFIQARRFDWTTAAGRYAAIYRDVIQAATPA
jgi:glycosyltransferase involved in cell wall biosynthesis